MAAFKSVAVFAPFAADYVQTAAAGTAPPAFIFVNPANSGEYFDVVEARAVYDVVGGASAAANVVIVPNGTALSAGTSCLSAAFDLTAAARIPYKATLTATAANRILGPGQSLAVLTSGTLTGLTGLAVVVILKPRTVKKVH